MGDDIVPLEGEFAPEAARGWEGKVFRRCVRKGRERQQRTLRHWMRRCMSSDRGVGGGGLSGAHGRDALWEVRMRRRLYRTRAGGTIRYWTNTWGSKPIKLPRQRCRRSAR